MSKEKKRERDRLRQIIDSLQVDPATAPIEDINEALDGEDVTKLRARLFQRAREIATAQRKQQIPVSRALQKFIDAMNRGTALPADRNDAFTKAVEHLQMPSAVSLASTSRQIEAYRKGDKDLSEKDKNVLKDAAERLRKRRDKKRSDAAIRGQAFVHVYGADCARRLEAIAAERGAEVEEVDADNFDGALLRYEDEALGIILLRSDIKEVARKRFTLAHELAHYLLPGHGTEPLHCRQQDIESWDDNIVNHEREANTFAAEILMPTSVVMPLLKRPPSFGTVREIARQCGSSLTASAYRLVELSTWRVAMVWSFDGKAKWYQPSDEFPFTIKRGPLDANTFAVDCFAGTSVPDHFEEVPAEAWLSSYNLKAGAMIKEHSRCLPSYNAALTLLYTDEFIEYETEYKTD